jgi:hydrogenase expression/formation protein HypC
MCLAIPGSILSIQGEDFGRSARVSFGGTVRDISLAYVPEAEIGDYVIVHAGFAINMLDEAEAMRTFRVFETDGRYRRIRKALCG